MEISNSNFWVNYLNEVSQDIMSGTVLDSGNSKKGIIVTDDSEGNLLKYVKQNLDYDKLEKSQNVKELVIDGSWTQYMTNNGNHDARELWNRLVKTTNRVRNGLLVLNIYSPEIFKHCWQIKQLAKQEGKLKAWCDDELFDMVNGFLNIDKLQDLTQQMKNEGKSKDEILAYVDKTLKEAALRKLAPSSVEFKGYVLLIVSGVSWDEVQDLARVHNSDEFDAMMEFCNLIKVAE